MHFHYFAQWYFTIVLYRSPHIPPQKSGFISHMDENLTSIMDYHGPSSGSVSSTVSSTVSSSYQWPIPARCDTSSLTKFTSWSSTEMMCWQLRLGHPGDSRSEESKRGSRPINDIGILVFFKLFYLSFILLFSVLFYSFLVCSILFCSVLYNSILFLFYFYFYSILFYLFVSKCISFFH